jgi:hypothetical protein
MQELIEKLTKGHGLTPEQSYGVLNTIKEFIIEKFPMAAGMLDNFFPAEADHQKGTDTDKAQAVAGATSTGDTGSTEGPESKGGSFLDNISEMIPGEMGEKAEQFIKDKVGNITGNKK